MADYVERERRAFRYRWDFPEPESTPLEVTAAAERWVQEADRYGLCHVVFLTGGGNDSLSRALSPFGDRFSGFAHHDPCRPDGAEELKRAVTKLGLTGYKIVAPQLSCSLQDPALDPLWSTVEALQIPVLIHFGILGGVGGIPVHPMINPLVLYPVARAYPTIPFIIPHFGSGYWRDLLHLCWTCPNVSLDTSGSNEWIRWEPQPLHLSDLFRRAYETVGPDRIIFGSDSSWFGRGFAYRYLQDQVRTCLEIGMKDGDLEAIFGGNAARLLRLPTVQAKEGF